MNAPHRPAAAFDPSPLERQQMIAVAAYYLAEHRGFAPGGELDDWQRAEQQINDMLAAMRRQGISRPELERAGLRNALQFWGSQPA